VLAGVTTDILDLETPQANGRGSLMVIAVLDDASAMIKADCVRGLQTLFLTVKPAN
jgi:hypothetical protein